MKTLLRFQMLVSLLAFSLGAAHAYDALQGPTELRYWDSTRAYNGYTLYGAHGITYLLDMEGRVVHTWPIGTNPHLLDNGHVLDAANNDPSGFSGFKEVDWDGNTAWQYLETRTTYHPHHDFTRIYNPKLGAYTTLYIANKDLTQAQCIAAGANPATVPSTGAQLDAVVEVDASGTVVWEWCFFDHIVQDFDATKPNYTGTGKTIADYPGKLDINLTGHPLKGDWLHCNSLDYNQSLDQIVTNSVQGEFYVIDHGGTFVAGDPTSSITLAATSAGDFLYRFGDPARYGQGSKPSILDDWTQSTTGNKQLGGAHDISWIGSGLNGAGHFLIFDNAQYLSEHTPQSYALEINPYLDANGTDTGHYVNPPDAGYNAWTSPAVTDKTPKQMSKQIVWSHNSKSSLTLFSHIGCSAQRLPNGNTLLCADTEGYISEVTAAGDVVWDYIVPVTGSSIVLNIGDNLPMVNSIFRAYRYGPTCAAFSGHTLTPGNTVAGRTTVENPYAGLSYSALQRPTEVQYWDSASAYGGYTLFGAQGTSHLIDMAGRVVNTWAQGTDPRLLDNGNLFDAATNGSGQGGFKELDWSGNAVWQYYETRSAYHPHGDFKRIFDPKLNAYATLYLANKDLTNAQCIAAGCDPANSPYTGAQADAIVEVDAGGAVVWEWCFFDHAIQDIDATKANYVGSGKTIADYPGRIDLNPPGRPVQSSWLRCNSLDYNASLDQIVVNSELGEFYVIDHGNTFIAGNPSGSVALAATSAGDFLYRFGDPARYAQGSAPSVNVNWEDATNGNKQIGASNNVQWIGAGLTGAGHFLVFNNNQYLFQRTAQSYVFEINPFLNSSGVDTGNYVNPPDAGYATWSFDKDTHKSAQKLSNQVVWKYGSVGNLTLFSHFGSSAQRLPNGNTLICATTEGYMVEVTAAGQVVWEYINPVTADGVVTDIGDRLPMTNAAPRAYRYGTGFAGFQGHDMTPGLTIAGRNPAASTPPTITQTSQAPIAPTAADAVWVTSNIATSTTISQATLTYNSGTGTGQTSTVFSETMGAAAAKPWTGGGCDNLWTVTVPSGQAVEQRTGSNYGTGNPCGLEFHVGTANLTDTMVTTTNAINAAGTSGYVEFWITAAGLTGTQGWTFQLDSGSGFVTRLSELTANSHAWQLYHYDLAPAELTAGLKMRFQFCGGTGDPRVDLDQITLAVTSGSGGSPVTVTMYDDGAHNDGASGNGVYGAQIPAFPAGTTVDYYVTATDSAALTLTDPSDAPATTYSYTVGNGAEGEGEGETEVAIGTMVYIPGGQFDMGDHFGFVDPDHPTDEMPIHTVNISSMYISNTLLTCSAYCAYLNAALASGLIEVRSGTVYAVGGSDMYYETTSAVPLSVITYSNNTFTVRSGRENHPITGIRWFGAVAYCNWLSAREGYIPCYDLATGACDFTKNGYRLPTEAEWEYAARGGQYNPYYQFPWGNDTNADGRLSNWQGSGDPWEDGDYPHTTPVGFYNGALHSKSAHNWPAADATYQTRDGSNAYGLYDMAGNVWEWVNDWYSNTYYQYCVDNGVIDNPPGPAAGDIMQDNLPWRAMRGGTWWNGGGQQFYGYSRVSNRDPSWSLGGSPDGNADSAWLQVGFRIMRPSRTTQTMGLFLNTGSAFNGYTLMAPMHYTRTYLINNAGLVVHTWDSTSEPGRTAYLLENGHMIRAGSVMNGGPSTGGGEGGRIDEYDWDGNLVWQLTYVSDNYIAHHDFKKLPNGNVIILVSEKKSYAEVVAAGFNPALLDNQISSQGYMLPDSIVEVQPTLPSGGTVVWEWHVWDHLIQDFNAAKNNYGTVASHPELIDANGTGGRIVQFWNHMNCLDYNADLDQIVMSVRGNSELWVIDHKTTTAQAAGHTGGRYNKGGDLLYRWGNPAQYKTGTAASQVFLQQHCTEWIDAGCPGAGNIIVFNNGISRGYSTIDEIVPPVDGSGAYSLTAGSAYGPSSYAWRYTAPNPTDFYSAEISGAQRLPNGNTLICEGVKGNLFEVTQTGQMVWHYVCPVTNSGPMTQGDTIPEDPAGVIDTQYMNAVFRVYRYPATYPGLVGRDLTPSGTIEIPVSGTLSVTFTASPTLGKPPLTVQFSGWAVGGQQIVDWEWDFGDGTIEQGNEPNPLHVYTEAGIYTVSATATGLSDSAMAVRRDLIQVSQTLSAGRPEVLGVLAALLALLGTVLLQRHPRVKRGTKQ